MQLLFKVHNMPDVTVVKYLFYVFYSSFKNCFYRYLSGELCSGCYLQMLYPVVLMVCDGAVDKENTTITTGVFVYLHTNKYVYVKYMCM